MYYDVFLIIAELSFVLMVFSYLRKTGVMATQSVTTLFLMSTHGGISYYEVMGFLTSALSLLIFDIVSASVDEDILDFASCLVFLFVGGSLIGFVMGFNVLSAYASLTPVSNGETTKSVYFSDVVNFALCALRIFLCWTRYIFYDIQVEHVDMALQFTDDIGNIVGTSVNGKYAIFFNVLFFMLDVIFMSFQISICLFKFVMAAFLLWLMLDLFLLRVSASSSESWLITTMLGKPWFINSKK